MINLAFSTNAFKKNSVTEAVDAIADIGYRGVEIMADVPHAYPERFGQRDREALKQQHSRRGLVVSNINAFTLFACGDTYHPTWIEEGRSLREVRIGHTIKSIELARELGATTVSLQPGGPMIGTPLSRDEAGQRFAEGIRRVLDTAHKHQITLGIEPEPGLFIQTAGEYLDFKNRFFANELRVKMNCDIGHLFCVGDDPARIIRQIPEHLAHVHLEDIGKNRVHQHLTPGKGVIDFAGIFQSLEAVKYAGWVTVELYPYETTAGGVAKMAWEHLSPLMEGGSPS